MNRLEHKIALITGASRGIGRGIAAAFAAEGCRLVLASRGAEQLENTAREFQSRGFEVLAVPTDVADPTQVEALFKQAVERFGHIDLLVNNAGAFNGGPLEQLSLEDWDHVMNVNLRGPFLCTRAALRIMKPRGAGRIINIGSISGERVRPNSAPYCTSKHGVWGLTQATALEGREYGVTCGCLNPGNILVERRVDTGSPDDDEPMIRVEDIAEVAVVMAALPPDVEMLQATVLPRNQLYVGRG